MDNELIFQEVDAGYYIAYTTNPINQELEVVVSSDGSCDELWSICDPVESYRELESGLFDTYISLEKDQYNLKFLGSFNSLENAEKHLNKLYQLGIKFETAPLIESEYYNADYSDKKQSIFV